MKRSRQNRRKAPRRELPKLPSLPRLGLNWGAFMAAVAGILVTVAALAQGSDLLELPVRKLEIEGSFRRVTDIEIEAVAEVRNESFLGLDLEAVRERIAGLAWVDRVRVQRIWPDTLKIVYTEHHAAARWGETGLLNTRGELITDSIRHSYPELPKLEGPEGSHRRVAARYLEIRDRLAATNLALESIRMDPRGAFSIDFVGGLSVRIGREDVDGRIDRFFSVVVPELAEVLERAAYVDMRYSNGFAVGWRNPELSQSQAVRLGARG